MLEPEVLRKGLQDLLGLTVVPAIGPMAVQLTLRDTAVGGEVDALLEGGLQDSPGPTGGDDRRAHQGAQAYYPSLPVPQQDWSCERSALRPLVSVGVGAGPPCRAAPFSA